MADMNEKSRLPERILLGVSGGIAAYKACELVRRLRDRASEVRVVMTANATRFVSPATFQALSGQPVHTSLWNENAEAAMSHIELARWSQQILVAPASADLLARLAHGLANDLLTTVCLATQAPLLVAPAMNRLMWTHPATQANIATLRRRGVRVLGPDEGSQACGETGPGRMLEVAAIMAALNHARPGPLHGLHVLVNAGPTYEDIDPVRFIGNRSSGRMGFAVAAAAVQAGAQVVLVAGPVVLDTPAGVERRINVRSAAEMYAAMLAEVKQADLVIAVAAVSDLRPLDVSPVKLKKPLLPEAIRLVENPDIVAAMSAQQPRPFVVGFAAETESLQAHALDKLRSKNLDMIAANLVSEGLGIEAEDNALDLYWHEGHVRLERANKETLAVRMVEQIAQRYQASRGDISHD